MSDIGFLIRTLEEVPADDSWLTRRERTFLRGRRSAKRVADWRLGRWTAKAAIRAFLELRGEVRPSAIEILADDDGAPRALTRSPALPVSLSLSHARGSALAVVGDPEVALGCDLERIEHRSPEFVSDYFTATESAMIASVENAQRALIINLLWSAKESALKALRCGLRVDTRSVEVALGLRSFGDWGSFVAIARQEERVFCGRWRSIGDLVATVVCPPMGPSLCDLEPIATCSHQPTRKTTKVTSSSSSSPLSPSTSFDRIVAISLGVSELSSVRR